MAGTYLTYRCSTPIVSDVRWPTPARDDLLRQVVDQDGERAARVVLNSCRSDDGRALTVLDAVRAMGDQGSPGEQPGIETLVVMLGSNNALGSVVQLAPCWTPDNYLQLSPEERLKAKGPYNVWQPAHFAAEWEQLVAALKSINSRHVILATIPQVTIAPIARGGGGKTSLGSRYFNYYTRPWITDEDFDAGETRVSPPTRHERSTRRSTRTTKR